MKKQSTIIKFLLLFFLSSNGFKATSDVLVGGLDRELLVELIKLSMKNSGEVNLGCDKAWKGTFNPKTRIISVRKDVQQMFIEAVEAINPRQVDLPKTFWEGVFALSPIAMALFLACLLWPRDAEIRRIEKLEALRAKYDLGTAAYDEETRKKLDRLDQKIIDLEDTVTYKQNCAFALVASTVTANLAFWAWAWWQSRKPIIRVAV